MSKKIIYKKNELLGDSTYHSGAMKDILRKDQKRNVINQTQEKKQLFKELKNYRDGGVTQKELKGVLAGLKYDSSSHFSTKEINLLSKELGLGYITKRHLLSKSLTHSSNLDKAHHVANFSTKSSMNPRRDLQRSRSVVSDDVIHYESRKFINKALGKKRRKVIKDGKMAFEVEEEDVEFFDKITGKNFVGISTRKTRPNMNMRNQSSLRGKGFVAGR